ncbi:MAG: ATP-binding cassette domain-containing protein [Planctomycetes bacterium]|nr:ATP-binding cassette domain-containing protein [Planctomycetota bacterium]
MIRIEAHQVCRYFHEARKDEVRALERISLTIPEGGFQVLVGPSGSGKSTLLAMLGALDRATSGRIVFDGQDLSDCSDVELARVRRRVGFVFQNLSLVPRLPNWENITYPLVPRGVPRAQRLEIARDLMNRFGILDKLVACPEELSMGEQQRVAVARALAAGPDAILADEPTSSLDRRAADDFFAILNDLHASGKTLVVATHDPALIELATAVAELDRGTLVRTSSD